MQYGHLPWRVKGSKYTDDDMTSTASDGTAEEEITSRAMRWIGFGGPPIVSEDLLDGSLALEGFLWVSSFHCK